VAVIEDGRIGETGALENVLRNPASATLRAFVAQLPPALQRASAAN
jgi:ABC-type methionine transport system ATPase subunit